MQRNLLIASHAAEDTDGLENVFSNLEEVRLLPSVSTGRDVIDTILSHDVDMLLLDLFLPSGDGFDVLDFISRLSEMRRPIVFVITAFTDDRLLTAALNRVAYCFTKPLEYELVQLRVLQIAGAKPALLARGADRLSLLEAQITAGIRAIGIPPHLKGYYYLREAIRIYALSEAPHMLNITTDVYPKVAEVFQTKDILVEHAIRNAIEIAWTRGNIETQHAYFGYTVNDYRGKPSNFEFIAMMAERALSYIG